MTNDEDTDNEDTDNEDDQLEAWGYVRHSQESDASIEKQKRLIREYANDRDDLALKTTRNDGRETSGFDSQRDEYLLIRSKIRKQEIDVLVTRDRARLSRDFDARLAIIQDLRESGVEWHVTEAGGRIDMDDEQTAAMECMHAMMDHTKKMVEIERAREVVQERQEEGYYQGKPPYGMEFDDDGQHLVTNENFETVETVISKIASGEASKRGLSKELDPSRSVIRGIWDRRGWYAEYVDDYSLPRGAAVVDDGE